MPRLIHRFSQGIAGLSDMIIERLQAFRRRSNVLSKRIIIFRDGVSEVHFRRIYFIVHPN
jgi:eukaryotic translation initiation factor 2C